MTISLNKELFEKQIQDELLYACGLRPSEFTAFSSNLESFQLLENIIETSALIDAADSPPLIDVVKQHKCEWSVLQAQMVSLLEVRFGPRVSSGFINIVSSLESSQLTFYELIDALKFVSEDGLRLLVNIIFASSLYPKVNSQLLNVSGGVGRSLSKVKKFSSVENKAHVTNLREVLDATGNKTEVKDHIHDLKTQNLLHSERNNFIHQDDVVPNTGSNKAKTFTKELKQENQFLNQGTVSIVSHSNHDNAENYTLKSATELPSLSVSQVREEMRDRLEIIGWSLGNKQTMVGGEEDKREQSPLLLHNERLGTTIHSDNLNIQSQLKRIQTDFNVFCKEVAGFKKACNAIGFVRDEIERAPKDIKDIFKYDALNKLSPETLRETNRLFQALSAISTKLDSPKMVNEFEKLQRIDEYLIKVDRSILYSRCFIKSCVIGNPSELEAVSNLDDAIKHLNDAKSDMKALRKDVQFLTDAETINQIIEFKSAFGTQLKNINNWFENHPGEIAQITVNWNDQDLQQLSSFFKDKDEFFIDYNLAGKALLNGHLQKYLTFSNKRMNLLKGISAGINDIQDRTFKSRFGADTGLTPHEILVINQVAQFLPKQEKLLKTLRNLPSFQNGDELNDIAKVLLDAQQLEQTVHKIVSSKEFTNLLNTLHSSNYKWETRFSQFRNSAVELHRIVNIADNVDENGALILKAFDTDLKPYVRDLAKIQAKETRIFGNLKAAFPNIDLQNVERSIWSDFCGFLAGIWQWISNL